MGDVMGEFNKGDVIVKIGDDSAYVVFGSYQTAMWYSLKYLNGGQILSTDMNINYIDSNYVKVDFCKNPMNDNEVLEKLCGLYRALSK